MLIKCPECQKEISDRALSCPTCGYPINLESNVEGTIICPDLPTDLAIGKEIVYWGSNIAVNGIYENSGNSNDKIPNGKVSLLLHTKGVSLMSRNNTHILDIHYSQIISVKELSGSELEDKSSIARAIVGGVVLGPLGAIIGGISVVGSKVTKMYYLIVNYWDIDSRSPFTISILYSTSLKHFIERFYIEKNKEVHELAMTEYMSKY